MYEESIYSLIQRVRERDGSDQIIAGEEYAHASKGNQWMVKITSNGGGGTLTESNAVNYTDHTLLLDHIYDMSRRTNSNVVSVNQFDSARPNFSNPLIKIPNDIWVPSMENILIKGILVELISLKRLSNTGQLNETIQRHDFKNNLLQAIVQDKDYIWIEFRTQHYTNEYTRVAQGTHPGGKNSFVYDIAQARIHTGVGSENTSDDAGDDETR